jgi:hypothetical protein
MLFLLLQGMAATVAIVHGPAHQHADLVLEQLGHWHEELHAHGESHHHAADELTLPTAAAAVGLDTVGLLLLAVPPTLGCGFPWRARCGASALPGFRPCWASEHIPDPFRKPPRG